MMVLKIIFLSIFLIVAASSTDIDFLAKGKEFWECEEAKKVERVYASTEISEVNEVIIEKIRALVTSSKLISLTSLSLRGVRGLKNENVHDFCFRDVSEELKVLPFSRLMSLDLSRTGVTCLALLHLLNSNTIGSVRDMKVYNAGSGEPMTVIKVIIDETIAAEEFSEGYPVKFDAHERLYTTSDEGKRPFEPFPYSHGFHVDFINSESVVVDIPVDNALKKIVVVLGEKIYGPVLSFGSVSSPQHQLVSNFSKMKISELEFSDERWRRLIQELRKCYTPKIITIMAGYSGSSARRNIEAMEGMTCLDIRKRWSLIDEYLQKEGKSIKDFVKE